MKSILIMLFMCATLAVRAQSESIAQDTIVWEVDQLTDRAQNSSEAFHCKFITSQSGIQWVQRDGNFVMNFSVTGSSGTWSDLSTDGTYEYSITLQDKTGNLRFERSGGTLTIRMSFLSNGTDTMPYSFHVDQYAKK